jgi:hypothetical protein
MEQIDPIEQKQHSSIFHGRQAPQQDLRGFSDDIGNISRRLRLLEESFTNMRRALQVTEQNMLDKNKMFSTEIRTINSDIGDIKKDIAGIKERIMELVEDVEESAKKEDVKVLEKYLEFWNPVRFVSQNEVESIVKEILSKKQANKSK